MGLLKKSGRVFIWSLLGSGFAFGFQIYLAAKLGQHEFGKANVLIGAVGILYAFSGFGFGTLTTRECGALREESESIFCNISIRLLVINLALIPVFSLALRLLLHSSSLSSGVYIAYGIMLLLSQTIGEQLYAYYRGISQAEKASFLRSFIQKVLYAISFFLISSLIGFEHNTMIYALIFSWLLPAFMTLKKVFRSRRTHLKYRISNSSATFFYLSTITYSLYSPLSKILQMNFSGEAAVGALAFGITLGIIAELFGSSFASVVMPEFSRLWKTRSYSELSEAFMSVSRWNAFLAMPIVAFVITNMTRIISIIGWESNGLESIVVLVLLSQFFSSFVGPNGTLLKMAGEERREMRNGVIKLIVGILLGFTLGPFFIWGIAFSIAAAEIVVNSLKYLQVKRLYGICPYNRRTLIFLIILAVSQIMAFSLAHLISNKLVWFFVIILLIAGAMSVAFMLSPEVKDRTMHKELWHHVKRSLQK